MSRIWSTFPHQDGSRLNTCLHFRLRAGLGTVPEAQDTLTTPVLGHKDWEEKRHRLLLQKMQLEVERERLQVQLAEQEGRLGRQKQPPRPPPLHSSRCSKGKKKKRISTFCSFVKCLQSGRLTGPHLLSSLIRDQQAGLSRSPSANGGLQMEAGARHQLPTRYAELETIFNRPIKREKKAD